MSVRQVKEEKRPFSDDSMRGPDVETRPRRPRRQVSRAGPYGTEVSAEVDAGPGHLRTCESGQGLEGFSKP